MAKEYTHEPMLEMYIFETDQMIEQLEKAILASEKMGCYDENTINEIFRIMHTIKGSSAMMLFNNIASLAHIIEDLFFYLREEKPVISDYCKISDLILESIDYIKVELVKIKNGDSVDGDTSIIIKSIKVFINQLKLENPQTDKNKNNPKSQIINQQYYISQEKLISPSNGKKYRAVIRFIEGCQMENIRAYTVIHNLRDISNEFIYAPEDIIDNDDSIEIIRDQGFKILFKSDKSYNDIYEFFMKTIFLKDLELTELDDNQEFIPITKQKVINLEDPTHKLPSLTNNFPKEQGENEVAATIIHQSIISVSVEKLDKLMDLVGEMVIAEAMVTQNTDLRGLNLDSFQKAARQLRKITSEIQDMVMSIRMVSLSTTFHKMQRIVRDMGKKLDKEVRLEIIGEETEVDKNIIEHIADPLMHLVRNAIDHGIENSYERQQKGKDTVGTVILEAKNAGSEVLIVVKDDGKGLRKDKILAKARENGLLHRAEGDMTDKEIYSLILLPGFSTKDNITEFSGRGVGMDVVTRNIETIGGSISIESGENIGTTITMKIPLTLAIIDGMNIRVGQSRYTIPTNAIKESFRPKASDIIEDPDGNEMIMVRGNCYPIVRLHRLYSVKTDVREFDEGIIIMLENNDRTLCLFADELIGQQQVVVKALPNYIKNFKKIKGLAGCTLLGDGGISLILDVEGLISQGY